MLFFVSVEILFCSLVSCLPGSHELARGVCISTKDVAAVDGAVSGIWGFVNPARRKEGEETD